MKEIFRGRKALEVPPNMDPVNQEMNEFLTKRMPTQRTLQISDFNWGDIRPDALDPRILGYVKYLWKIEVNAPNYIQKHEDSASRDGATWKTDWFEDPNGWANQEEAHANILGEYLVRAGILSREEMEAEKNAIRERPFTIGEGYNFVKSDVYGFIQESLTAPSYAIALEASRPDPVLHKNLSDILAQESFHSSVFSKAVEVDIKHNPGRKEDVIRAVGDFKMPTSQVVDKEDHDEALESARIYHFPRRKVFSRLSTALIKTLGDSGAGKAASLYVRNNEDFPAYAKLAAVVLPNTLFAKAADLYIRKKMPETL